MQRVCKVAQHLEPKESAERNSRSMCCGMRRFRVCFAVLCCVVLCRVVSCRVVLCRVVSCRVVLCCVLFCCVVFCCVVLCRGTTTSSNTFAAKAGRSASHQSRAAAYRLLNYFGCSGHEAQLRRVGSTTAAALLLRKQSSCCMAPAHHQSQQQAPSPEPPATWTPDSWPAPCYPPHR